jgi:iron(III) transport system ATP-binding protein
VFLELSGLSRSFDGTKVIRDLTLNVDQGEVVCLLGSSGCGKTTTLRLVGGFLAPDVGSVRVDGVDVTRLSPEVRPTATVFQSYALFPHLTVAGNVAYGLRFVGVARREAEGRVCEMLDAVGLSDQGDAHVDELSGGQQQRVALARALVVGPKVLLLDEPFSNLDANLRLRMREEVHQIQRRFGVTMLFVTHDREEALAFGDRVAIMREGSLSQVGNPQEVYRHPADLYCARFLGHVNELEVGGRRLLFRSEDVLLGREGGLTGRVTDASYLGPIWEYRLDVGGSEVVARAPRQCRYTRGDTVPLAIAETFSV